MNQSKLKLHVTDGKRGKTSERVAIGFGFTADWKRSTSLFFFFTPIVNVVDLNPITFRRSNENRSKALPNYFKIFATHLPPAGICEQKVTFSISFIK